MIKISIKKPNSLNAQNELHVPLIFAAQCKYFFYFIARCYNATFVALKNSGHQRDVTDNGCKKKKASADVGNSKAAKCKIAGDAYHMNCNTVIIIIVFAVTIIARSLSNFPIFYRHCHSVRKHTMDAVN